MIKITKSRLEQLSRKYLGRAGNTKFADGTMFHAAGMEREAALADQIHDLSYKLGRALEERMELSK